MYLFSFFIFMVCSSRLVCAASWNFEIYSLGRRSIQFNLRAHLLQTSGKNLNLLFLLRDRRFQFLHLAVLFEEFIEQHGVHRVVAHGVNLTVLIAHHQVGVHFGNFLGDQTKLRRTGLVPLIVECHRLKRQDCFTGTLHRFNLFLEPPRRAGRAQLAGRINENWYGVGVLSLHVANVADKAGEIHVRACDVRADTDNVSCRGDVAAGQIAQSRVVGAADILRKRSPADGRVPISKCLVKERAKSHGRVVVVIEVVEERLKTNSCVFGADGIAKERLITVGRVEAAFGVARERRKTAGCVVGADGVESERINTGGRVGTADGVGNERANTDGRVAVAGSVVMEGANTVSRIAAAFGVVKKGERSVGRVLEAGGVAEKRPGASGRILVCGVAQERSSADTRAEVAVSEAYNRKQTNCRIECGAGDTL